MNIDISDDMITLVQIIIFEIFIAETKKRSFLSSTSDVIDYERNAVEIFAKQNRTCSSFHLNNSI